MANFEGAKDYPIDRLASYVDWDDPVVLPLGMAVLTKNARYSQEGCGTRFGTKITITGGHGAINGLACLNYHGISNANYPLVFGADGTLLKESPEGSGTLVPITPTIGSLTAGSYMLDTPAYGREYLCFTDLKTTKSGNFVFDGKTGFLDPISMAPNATPASMTSSGLSGNICAGVRWAVVLFQNRNGYISGASTAAIFTYNVPTAGFQITVSSLPLGPVNTIARIVAFTVAGDGSAGSYFYIPFNDTVSGIAMTATVVNDNTTTSATFNFTDQYLEQSVDVSDFTTQIQIPAAKNITFSRSLRKMVYTAPTGFETGYLISATDDPENCTGDTSFLAPGTTQDDPMGWAELHGNQYALKSASGHIVNPSADNPNTWDAREAWAGTGPCGPRAWDVSTPADEEEQAFIVYAHKSGLYIFTGNDPAPKTKFVQNVWNRINWTYKHLVAVTIDDDAREIKVCCPLDGATQNNTVITLNYIYGFADPILFSHYLKKWLPNPEGMKFSIDTYPSGVNQIVVAQRTLATPVNPLIDTRQVLLGCQDGNVKYVNPNVYQDDANGIDTQYQTAYASEEDLATFALAGLKVKAKGSGILTLTPMTPQGQYGTRSSSVDITASNGNAYRFDVQAQAGQEADHVGYLITNSYNSSVPTQNAGTWFEVLELDIMARRKWRAKRG